MSRRSSSPRQKNSQGSPLLYLIFAADFREELHKPFLPKVTPLIQQHPNKLRQALVGSPAPVGVSRSRRACHNSSSSLLCRFPLELDNFAVMVIDRDTSPTQPSIHRLSSTVPPMMLETQGCRQAEHLNARSGEWLIGFCPPAPSTRALHFTPSYHVSGVSSLAKVC